MTHRVVAICDVGVFTFLFPVIRRAYKRELKTFYKTTYFTAYRCCSGWREMNGQCIIRERRKRVDIGPFFIYLFRAAICNQACQNGGACMKPNTCSCASGWGGPKCSVGKIVLLLTQPCSGYIFIFSMFSLSVACVHSYGPGCTLPCNCVNHGQCSRYTGACTCTAPGFFGIYCERSCNFGFYGVNCAKKCDYCTNGAGCDSITGSCQCLAGYKGT